MLFDFVYITTFYFLREFFYKKDLLIIEFNKIFFDNLPKFGTFTSSQHRKFIVFIC